MWTLIRCFLCVTCFFTLQETWLCLCSGMTCYHSAMMLAGISFLLALFACWCVMLYSFPNYIYFCLIHLASFLRERSKAKRMM